MGSVTGTAVRWPTPSAIHLAHKDALINYSDIGIVTSMDYMSVTEAANLLGVTDRRVRAMITDGLLEAHRVGGRWLMTGSEVARTKSVRRRPGRPYSPRLAWGLLAIAGDRPALWLSASERQRLETVLASTTIEEIAPALRRRADPRRWYVHPGLLPDFVEDPRTVVTGPSATSKLRHTGPEHLYVPAVTVDDLRSDYRPLTESENPNAVVWTVHGDWPFVDGERTAWPVVVAIDLLDQSLDARAQRVAGEILSGTRA